MRFLLPLIAVILIATLFPNNPLSLVAYVLLALSSLLLAASQLRKTSPPRRRQIVLTFSLAVVVILGIGVWLSLR